MRLHGGFGDGKADTGAADDARVGLIRPVKAVEQAGGINVLRSANGVGDGDLRPFPAALRFQAGAAAVSGILERVVQA